MPAMLALIAMTTLTVRNLDEGVKLALRRRAAEHGHSLEEEVRRTLRDAVRDPSKPKSGAELLQRIRAIVEPIGGIELEIPPRKAARKAPKIG